MNFSVSEIITSDFRSQAATAGLFSTGSIVALNYVKRMRRIFKVSFYIRGNHVNKDDTCAVMIRLSLDGERISAGTTGISIKPELWDGQRQQLKGRSTEVLQTNKKLGGIRDELLAIAEKLEFEGSLALDRVKAVFLGVDEDYDTIGKLFDKYIKNVKEQVDVCLSKTFLSKYELCRRRFMQMLEKKYHRKDISLKELNPIVVQDYKNFLMTDVNMCNNTAVKTMKTFRTVILYGIKLGVIHKDPFVGVHFHMEKVDRGFLTDEEISAIMTKKFDLQRLDLEHHLTKTILYNLNPAANEVMATMLGNFQDGSVAGKIQWGSGWWFLDQKDGIQKQLNALSLLGLLSRFVGMLTDSRSFLSYPRHEYFRRILCNVIGTDVENGEIPFTGYEKERVEKMVEDISYYNAKNYFKF